MLDVITVIDDSGCIAYQSKSIDRVLGYDPQPMLGQKVTGYIHPDDVHIVQTALHQLLTGELETNEAEFRFRHHNGDYKQIHAIARLWDRTGMRGVVVNSRDITPAFVAQQELAKRNELLETTFAVSNNGLSITIPGTGEILKVNETWCELLGYTQEEVLGKTALELGIWGAAENRDRVIAELGQEGRLQNYDAVAYTSTGEKLLMVVDAQLLQIADEPQLLMSCTNVTDSRRVEEELRQSQKMDAIGQLTGGVAHDFNNLIGVTMGNAELLLDLVAKHPEALDHTQQILDAAERGANLTQQLLAFARRQNLAPEPVDLVRHLNSARSILQTSVSENTVLDITSDADLWHCLVDPNQLQTALLNLTLNAHDAMPDGGLLHFQLCNFATAGDEKFFSDQTIIGELSAGEYVALTITDTGTGMDATTRSRVFEPFFTTKTRERGTGLGLSMVFGFVEQSGGALCLQSEADVGTSLTMLLPRALEVGKAVTVVDGESPRGRRLQAKEIRTVLVVEDNNPLRSVLVRALKDMDYSVLEAADEQQLEGVLSAASSIDLLLSDVILKDRKRGPEIAERVVDRYPQAEVLLMTGFSPDDVLRGTQYPVLMKPFTLVELSEVVDNMLTAGDHQRSLV